MAYSSAFDQVTAAHRLSRRRSKLGLVLVGVAGLGGVSAFAMGAATVATSLVAGSFENGASRPTIREADPRILGNARTRLISNGFSSQTRLADLSSLPVSIEGRPVGLPDDATPSAVVETVAIVPPPEPPEDLTAAITPSPDQASKPLAGAVLASIAPAQAPAVLDTASALAPTAEAAPSIETAPEPDSPPSVVQLPPAREVGPVASAFKDIPLPPTNPLRRMTAPELASLDSEAAPTPIVPEEPIPLPQARPVIRVPSPVLASVRPEDRAPSPPTTRDSGVSVPSFGNRVAVYDISAHTVYLPNGERLEAHSGLGGMLDNPRYVSAKNRGPTPPHTYDLSMREQLFHGVPAIRLNPTEGGKLYGRDGLLAHTYMLGARGDSNGCVSFRDYHKFLAAYQSGQVKQLKVVASLNGESPPGRRGFWWFTSLGK